MKTYAYKKTDAFTSGLSMGNPAAFLLVGEDTLTEAEMLNFGKQHAGFVSEVVFCSASRAADVKLTYYSSECEVAFCGHGTIAAMYELIKSDPALRKKSEVTIETNKKGILTVFNALDAEDCVYITAPEGEALPLPVSASEAEAALGIKISPEYPLDFIDGGLRTLLVPAGSLKEEVSLYPDRKELQAFCENSGIDIILMFCMETESPSALAHTRVFAPRFGYLEDPATGSGNSAFGYYLLRRGLWDGSAASIEQGGDNMVFNEVKIKSQNNRILFGGRASLRIEGTYYMG